LLSDPYFYVKRIPEVDLAAAMAALDNARVALSICRSRLSPVFPDTVMAIASDRAAGNKFGVDENRLPPSAEAALHEICYLRLRPLYDDFCSEQLRSATVLSVESRSWQGLRTR
jgi:hypothetical protein